MKHDTDATTLTDGQRAALAKLACGVALPGSLAVLCGPPGTGKTTVLARLAAGQVRGGRSCSAMRLADWLSQVDDIDALPDVLVADDAHEVDATTLGRLLAATGRRRPGMAVVLGGEGRLLTLVSRDRQVEQMVALRATLHPFSAAETRRLLEPLLPRVASAPEFADVARTIHEIAAGIPRAALKLGELAAVVADSRSDGRLTVADVEQIHRRLLLQAA
jgi:type II secretory pathway predicted ATPase ExeA